jgi:hypothetical protein
VCAVLIPALIARAMGLRIAKRLQGTLIVLLTVGAVACAGAIVRFTHIVWSGFFLAFFALAFHAPVEDLLHMIASNLRRSKAPAETAE